MIARIAAVLLMIAQPAQAYLLLDGPMPALLGGGKVQPVAQLKGYTPAPRPNLDASAPPEQGPKGPVIKPGLINRSTTQGTSANGAINSSAFSDQLERRNRTSTNIGTTLAPAIVFSRPLQ